MVPGAIRFFHTFVRGANADAAWEARGEATPTGHRWSRLAEARVGWLCTAAGDTTPPAPVDMVVTFPVASALDEFRSSLKQGTGRAMLILRGDPHDPDLQAALLAACRTNLVFDPQCEPARAPYLRRLILAAGQVEAVRRDLAALLAAEPPPGATEDLVQAYELLCLLADDAPGFDRRILWDFPGRTDRAAALAACLAALVRLEGLPAFLEAVARFRGDGSLWLSDFEQLREALRERDGPVSADAALADARRLSPDLDRLLSDLDVRAGRAEEPADGEGYAAIRKRLLAGSVRFPARWRERASPADLAAAAADLLAETDDERRVPYLRLFARVDFPLPPEPLLPLLASAHRQVKYQAARMLARLDHPAVRCLALDALRDATTEWHLGLTLLAGSATDADARLFGPLIDASPDDEELHRRCSDILRIVESGRLSAEAAAPLLVRIYEETPCSNCRGDAVRLLARYGRLPPWLAAECVFDVDEVTAAIASAASGPATGEPGPGEGVREV